MDEASNGMAKCLMIHVKQSFDPVIGNQRVHDQASRETAAGVGAGLCRDLPPPVLAVAWAPVGGLGNPRGLSPLGGCGLTPVAGSGKTRTRIWRDVWASGARADGRGVQGGRVAGRKLRPC